GSRGWGRDVRLIGPGLMVFDGRQGFVGASYRFAPEDYRQVYETLRRTLGSPNTERAETITWLAGANTVYVLDLTEGGRTGVVTVADREFWFSRSVLFEFL
ncbi:MAG TPA: hypothetical protein VN521_08375, partial [Negativicutes bacterium]|nr:hypothetical protein [Negativicutes bacterium]